MSLNTKQPARNERRSLVLRNIKKGSWLIVLFDVLAIFFLTGAVERAGLAAALFYLLWLILSLLACVSWLVFHYRKSLRGWLNIILSLFLLLLSSLRVEYFSLPAVVGLDLFFVLLNVVSGWAFGLGVAIRLWRKDDGLFFVAWVSIVMIWLVFIAWRIQGNLIQLSFNQIANPNNASLIWWLNPLLCVVGWSLPLGFISYLLHTVKVFIKEFDDKN